MTEEEQPVADLLEDLRQEIAKRRIRSGIDRIEQHRSRIDSAGPDSSQTPRLIWQLAQWVDAGWSGLATVETLLARFDRAARGRLTLSDYAALRMAEGLIAMAAEEADLAISHFTIALQLEKDLPDREIVVIANFWKARCHRQKGEYDDALLHVTRARDLAMEGGYEHTAAVMRVLESWLCFQSGKYKDALRKLAEAEAVLAVSDDPVVLGNIQSTYGRIYRQEGRYDRAIDHFTQAIAHYRDFDAQHPNLARTLANLGYVKRLVALDLRRRFDASIARRRLGGRPNDVAPTSDRETLSRICEEAMAAQDEAAAIYRIHPNHRGTGMVHLNRGLLHLDNGALDIAGDEAALAFTLGEEKQDTILMARARILACMVENAELEEGIEGDPRRHAQAALDYIHDALDLAKNTENRRLLARAHTWHGLTLANSFFHSYPAAVEAMNGAAGYLDHGYHDTAWQDLQTLKGRVSGSETVDETLRAWSHGALGNKTFRQISDQFAEILIPKVWELEGRKIARVAARLSISPKKVKRALMRSGVLTEIGKDEQAEAVPE